MYMSLILLSLWTMQSVSGKLILSCVGHNGRHTELYIDEQLVFAGFNTNCSILLALWFACDQDGLDINKALNIKSSDYVEYNFDKLFNRVLLSKYDTLYDNHAVGNAYSLFLTHGYNLQNVLDILNAFYLYVQNKFCITDLTIEYVIDEENIYDKI